jgi:hypothetical protein
METHSPQASCHGENHESLTREVSVFSRTVSCPIDKANVSSSPTSIDPSRHHSHISFQIPSHCSADELDLTSFIIWTRQTWCHTTMAGSILSPGLEVQQLYRCMVAEVASNISPITSFDDIWSPEHDKTHALDPWAATDDGPRPIIVRST